MPDMDNNKKKTSEFISSDAFLYLEKVRETQLLLDVLRDGKKYIKEDHKSLLVFYYQAEAELLDVLHDYQRKYERSVGGDIYYLLIELRNNGNYGFRKYIYGD